MHSSSMELSELSRYSCFYENKKNKKSIILSREFVKRLRSMN